MHRRNLIVSLGGLWLLDAVLQLQPAMFTGAFAQTILVPNLQNQPHGIAAIIAFGIRIATINPFWFNYVAAGLQIVIGALLFFPLLGRRDDGTRADNNLIRFALWLSVAWALIIWIFGEGLGGLATGAATFYTGAPGSALLYAILALFLLSDMRATADRRGKGSQPIEKLPAAAGVIFLLGAALNVLPMFWQPTMLSMLASIPAISNWLGGFGVQGTLLGNFLAVDVLAALGIFLILLPRNRSVAWVAIVFLAVVWVIGQNFGGILTFPGGTATDPNSAPILALFLL